MAITIGNPNTPADFDQVRDLCWAYRDFLLGLGPIDREIVETYYPVEKYQKVLDQLEVDNVPPKGGAVLAKKDGIPVGCAMWHCLFPDTAEAKRVYVSADARGTGVAREMMNVLIEQVRTAGLSRILLDTGEPLKAAQNLYLSRGFRKRGFYQDVPKIAEERLICFELTL